MDVTFWWNSKCVNVGRGVGLVIGFFVGNGIGNTSLLCAIRGYLLVW